MKCPYCGGEMEGGRISAAKGVLAWTPENKRKSILAWGVKKYEVRLGGSDFFDSAETAASLCVECKKVIIDIM